MRLGWGEGGGGASCGDRIFSYFKCKILVVFPNVIEVVVRRMNFCRLPTYDMRSVHSGEGAY